ncbi:glycosyltransferase [Gordonia iterans]
MTGSHIRQLSVVIPAHNEEAAISACLRSLAWATESLYRDLGDRSPRVRVVVVLDRCIDATGRIAAAFGADVVQTTGGSVGIARRVGVAHSLIEAAPPSTHWIANTDADSIVPADWLRTHHKHAAAGARVLTGLVEPDRRALTAAQLARWHALQPNTAAHRRVHGANLGVRADTYLQMGGFPDIASGEDRGLVEAARRLDVTVTPTTESPVLTSARRTGRAPLGFAQWLSDHIYADPQTPATAL